MPLHAFTSGEVLTAANQNQVARQVVITCQSSSRPSSPDTGMVIYETDTKRIRAYSGSAWNVIAWGSSSGRVGCVLDDAAVAYTSGSDATVNWDTPAGFDSDSFYATGGTITIPTGLGGLYMAMVECDWSNDVGTLGGKIHFVVNGSIRYRHSMPAGVSDDCAAFGPTRLSAGDAVTITMRQTKGVSVNGSAHLDFFYIGP